jgi:hypothetical protein
MFSWLFEGHSSIYLVLGAAAVALLALWWRTRKRRYAVALGLVPVLAGLYGLLDVAVETDGEQISRTVQGMAAGVGAGALDRVFEHVAEQFTSPAGRDKRAARQEADTVRRQYGVREVTVWGFEPKAVSRPTRTARVEFRVKVRSHLSRDVEFFLCRAEFVLEGDGQWRLKGFQLFNPFVETDQPLPVPF